ncbi:MAG: hypothetical protein JW704_12725 [Anaerolineaceae bacterium]|nr:hypothetical protein [Anaerolineaceae bacterium]
MRKTTSAVTHKQHPPALPGWFWLSAALLIVLRLWLVRGMTFNGIGYMTADDQLFIHQAASILRGEWLGEYHFLTLFKGPFYPLFIAGSSLLGIPLLTAQQLLYSAACLSFCIALSSLTRKPSIILLLLVLLLFNPMGFTNTVATRALREGIYPALTLLTLAGLLGLVLRLERPTRQIWGWSLMAGLALGAFWLTREERIWLIPSLAILIGMTAWRVWGEKRLNWQKAWTVLVIPGFILGLGILVVAGLNLRHYGLFAITEYDSQVFLKAYGALTRVTPKDWQARIPVAAETRARIYAVSPAFRQLEPWLEGQVGQMYARYGELVKSNRAEMGGGWFHMALRDSIDQAGISADGRFPEDYYRQMTAEINSACDSGALDCAPPRASFMAVWNNAYIKPLAGNLWEAVRFLVTFDGYDGELKDCLGTEEQLAPFIALSGEQCWHTHPSVLVQGWAVKPGELISIWVYDDQKRKVVSPTRHMSSPDLVAHFDQLGLEAPEAAVARFQLEADCQTGCSLVVKADDGRVLKEIALGSLSGSPTAADENGLYCQIESIDWRQGDEQEFPQLYRLNRIRARLLGGVAVVYQKTIPFIVVIALLTYILQMFALLKKREHLAQRLIESTLLAGLLTRLVVVAWLQTSSIDAIITTYMSPLYPLLLSFLCLSIFAAAQSLPAWMRSLATTRAK